MSKMSNVLVVTGMSMCTCHHGDMPDWSPIPGVRLMTVMTSLSVRDKISQSHRAPSFTWSDNFHQSYLAQKCERSPNCQNKRIPFCVISTPLHLLTFVRDGFTLEIWPSSIPAIQLWLQWGGGPFMEDHNIFISNSWIIMKFSLMTFLQILLYLFTCSIFSWKINDFCINLICYEQ